MSKIRNLNTGDRITKKMFADKQSEYFNFYNDPNTTDEQRAQLDTIMQSGQNVSSADEMNNRSQREYAYHLYDAALAAIRDGRPMPNAPVASTRNLFNGYSHQENKNNAYTTVYQTMHPRVTDNVNQSGQYGTSSTYYSNSSSAQNNPSLASNKQYYDYKWDRFLDTSLLLNTDTFDKRYKRFVDGLISSLEAARDSGKTIRGLDPKTVDKIEDMLTQLKGIRNQTDDRVTALETLTNFLAPLKITHDKFNAFFEEFLPEQSQADTNRNKLLNQQYRDVDISSFSDYLKNVISSNNIHLMEDVHGNRYAYDQNYNLITEPFVQINDDYNLEGVEGSSYGHGLLIDKQGNVFIGDTSKIIDGHKFKQTLDDYVANMKRRGLWLTKNWNNSSYTEDQLTNHVADYFRGQGISNFSYTDVGALFPGTNQVIAFNINGRPLQWSRYGDIKFDNDTRFAYTGSDGKTHVGTLSDVQQSIGAYKRSGYGEDNLGTGVQPDDLSHLFDDAETISTNSLLYDGFLRVGNIYINENLTAFVKAMLEALSSNDDSKEITLFGTDKKIKISDLLSNLDYYNNEKKVLALIGKLVESGNIYLTDEEYAKYIRFVRNRYASMMKKKQTESQKQGGTLKFDYGGSAPLLTSNSNLNNSSNEGQAVKEFKKRAEQANKEGYSGVKQYDAAKSTDIDWGTDDSFRAGALLTDIIGLIGAASGAITGGAGSIAAEASGFLSTGLDLTADILDPSVSKGDVIKNLAKNTGLSLGAFLGAKTPKIIKSAMKIIPRAATAIATAGIALDDDVHATIKKLYDGKEELNAQDWQNLYMVLKTVIGLGTYGFQEGSYHKAKKKLDSIKTVDSTIDPDITYIENPSSGAPIALPKEQANKVKAHLEKGETANARQILGELKKPGSEDRLLTDAQIADLTDTSRSWRNWFRKKNNFKDANLKETTSIDPEALQKLIQSEEANVKNSGVQKVFNTLDNLFMFQFDGAPKTAVELAAMRELGIKQWKRDSRQRLNDEIQSRIDALPYVIDPEVLNTKFNEDAFIQTRRSTKTNLAKQNLDDLKNTKNTLKAKNFNLEVAQKAVDDFRIGDQTIEEFKAKLESDKAWLKDERNIKSQDLNDKIAGIEKQLRKKTLNPVSRTEFESQKAELEKELQSITDRAIALNSGKESVSKRTSKLQKAETELSTKQEALEQAKTEQSTAKQTFKQLREDIKKKRVSAENQAEDEFIRNAQTGAHKIKKDVTIKSSNGEDVTLKEGSSVISLIGRDVNKAKAYAQRAAGNDAKEIKKSDLSKIIKDTSKVNGAFVAENGTLYIYQQGGKTKYSHLRK